MTIQVQQVLRIHYNFRGFFLTPSCHEANSDITKRQDTGVSLRQGNTIVN